MTEELAGDGFRLRRAAAEDADFVVALASHEDVEPFMSSVAPRDRDTVLDALRESARAPNERGRFVVEVDGIPAGVMGFEVSNRRSRIASLMGLMLHPEFRGRGIADEAAKVLVRHLIFDLDYHRVELECYGFNERAIRHAERAGFVKEGIKHKAYWRHEEWVDGVLFALVREDLE